MLCIAHRGASGDYPENTAAAIEAAIEQGAPWIEFDLRLSADQELVVIHDPTVDRTSNGFGRVDQLSLAELKTYDFGNGERILTLSELLDLVAGRANLNVEFCALGVAERAMPIIDQAIAEGKWRPEQILLSSFMESELLTARAQNADVRLGALTGGVPADLCSWATGLDAWSVHLHFGFLDQLTVDAAQAAGLKVYVYTVNHPQDFAYCSALGVNGVFTDFPQRALELSGEKCG